MAKKPTQKKVAAKKKTAKKGIHFNPPENVAYLSSNEINDKTLEVLKECAENSSFGAIGDNTLLVNIRDLEEFVNELGGSTSKELSELIDINHNFLIVEM